MNPFRRPSRSGVTLTELMIAVAVMSVAVIGLIATFLNIQKGIQISKNKTLGANLVQEKLQILAQKNYYQVLVTPTIYYSTVTTPNIPYDLAYFPPETILEGGVTYTRYTCVQVVTEDSGSIVVKDPLTTDTGMRLLTVSVVWNDGGNWRSASVNSVLSNPAAVMTTSIFKGNIKDSVTSANLTGAQVTIAENMGWVDTADGSGNYLVNMMPGNFTAVVSKWGYFSQHYPFSIAANATATQNFSLLPMSSGTIVGYAWMNPHILISQVVSSTRQADNSNFIAQYVELYNPTASTVTIRSGGVPAILLNFETGKNSGGSTCSNPRVCTNATSAVGVKLDYVRDTVPPFSYYIIANTSTFMVNGVRVFADAIYADDANTSCSPQPTAGEWVPGAMPQVKQIIEIGHGGAVWLTDASGTVIDSVGWKHTSNSHPVCDPYCIPTNSDSSGNPNGLPDGVQLVRTSSPNVPSNVWGRAYDTGVSSIDFVYPNVISGIPYQPYSGFNSTAPVIAGTPAIGAVVTVNDGLSGSTKAYALGYPPAAYFNLVGVATVSAPSAWTVLVTSGSYMFSYATVTVPTQGYVYAFPSSTTFLDQTPTQGYISGTVLDGFGAPISAPSAITVSGGGNNTTASVVNGRYILGVSPGSIDMLVNPASANGSYITASSEAVTVTLGQIRDDLNFILSQGGRVSGYITRDGVNGLPGVTVAIVDANGYAQDTPVSDSNGRFTSTVISTGPYNVSPQLDSLEVSSPSLKAVTVTNGANTFSSTFTILGALGTVSGSVSLSGRPISTGVLIVVTTNTALAAPPSLSTGTLTGMAYYVTSSKEDGTYSVDVRQSTYTVYAWFPSVSVSGAISNRTGSIANVAVTAGQTASGKNFSW